MAEQSGDVLVTDRAINELLARAKVAFKERDLKQAVRFCEEALQHNEARADVHQLAGTCQFMLKDFDAAVKHFKRVTELDPMDGKPLINLGAVYNRVGQYQQAVEVLRKGVAKARNSGEGYYNLAFAYRNLGQMSMAVSAYREALRLDPRMTDAHVNLANLFTELGNYSQAILHYKKALEISPDSERARTGLAQAQRQAAASRSMESPFGRLVDTQSYQQASDSESVNRTLTLQQRQEDRQALYRLTKEIREVARLLVEQLKHNFEPSVLALSRAVTQGDDAFRLAEMYERFAEAFKTTNDFRERLRHKMLQVRAHEELMNTPDMPASL